jgi:putative ABC transport system permease protein
VTVAVSEIRQAARSLLRNPSFTVAAIAALTLGIATNTAIFSVVDAVLLKPFVYRDAGRIVMFQNTFRDGVRSGSAAPVEFNWWRRETRSFQDIAAYDFGVANWTGESFPEQVPIMHVSADFFRLCGIHVAGHTFTSADDLPGAPKSAVLGYSFWQRRFAGDPNVIGRRLVLSGAPYEVIGVAEARLEDGQIAEQSLGSGDIEINRPPDIYLPFQLDPHSRERGHYFNAAGRLKPGVTLAAANSELQASYRVYARQWMDLTPGASFGVQPLQDAVVGGVRNSLLLVWGAVGLVLLIACANVANLLLARGASRKREMAIRRALGAGRIWIIRQLLTESVMLGLAGGVLGLAVGYAGIRAILTLVPDNLPRIGAAGSNVVMDWRIVGFTFSLSIVTGVLFGLLPAVMASRADPSGAMKKSRTTQTRALLVSGEMAIALVLLIGAALLIRSFLAIRHVNSGFDAHNVLTMRMSLDGPQFGTPAAFTELVHQGLHRISLLPGVESAAATCCVPLQDRFWTDFQIAVRPGAPDSGAGFALVSAGYFETLGIPILRGRTFTEQDDGGPPVVIINQTLAKRFWPASEPLGNRILIGNDPPRQIIGIASDVRDDALNHEPRPMLYELSAQMAGNKLLKDVPWAWIIRTRVAPLSLSSAIQKELREASGGLPVAQVRTMEETLSRSTATENFRTLVLTIFGCAALLLATIGVYGLMAYSVAQRVQEIGIRMALGAAASHIRIMIAVEGLRPALAGVACGLISAFGLTRWIAGFLFGVKPWDPLVFFMVPVFLLTVALAAVWWPAMRASRIDPAGALRHLG